MMPVSTKIQQENVERAEKLGLSKEDFGRLWTFTVEANPGGGFAGNVRDLREYLDRIEAGETVDQIIASEKWW